jgi:hypothetical protein
MNVLVIKPLMIFWQAESIDNYANWHLQTTV